jgi:uracil-DNA glycosylase
MIEALWRECPLESRPWRALITEVLAREPGVALALATTISARRDRLLPPPRQVFAALELTALEDVRVVILGQDPYPTPGDAHGLAFSVPHGREIPRSLANIIAEIERDTGERRADGDLSDWARQGVLLLNAVLTYEQEGPDGEAQSHKGMGWELVTAAILRAVLARPAPLVLMGWGRQAQAVLDAASGAPGAVARTEGVSAGGGALLRLGATHPSPLSCRRAAGGLPAFMRCGHFGAANAFLVQRGLAPIRWGAPARR